MKLGARPAGQQEIQGAVRSRALESIFGLGLPAAELVLRPGVLQFQLPLLSLCKEEGAGESHTKVLRNIFLLPLCTSQFKVFLPSKQLCGKSKSLGRFNFPLIQAEGEDPEKAKKNHLFGELIGFKQNKDSRILVLHQLELKLRCSSRKWTNEKLNLASERKTTGYLGYLTSQAGEDSPEDVDRSKRDTSHVWGHRLLLC